MVKRAPIERRRYQRRVMRDRREAIRFELEKVDRRGQRDRRRGNCAWDVRNRKL